MNRKDAQPLIDRVLDLENLRFAWIRVRTANGNAGGDGVTLGRFQRLLDHHLLTLAGDVRSGAYQPGRFRIVHVVMRGRARTLSILPVRDRVLQRAVLDILTPVIDRRFLTSSYGYRPGLSVRDAVDRVLVLRDRGFTSVVDADIDNCFPSLDHELLSGFIDEMAPDETLRGLMRQWMRTPPSASSSSAVRGIPLGAVVSPLLCNIYLHHMDESLRRRRFHLVRYADDFVILCKSEAHAEHALRATEKVLAGLRLDLEPRKTSITTFDDEFTFLGVTFGPDWYRYNIDGKTIEVENALPDWFYHHPADPYE